MRILLAALFLTLASSALAQSPSDRNLPTQPYQARKPPVQGLQPVPEPPPAPPGVENDPALEPQVTIQRRGTDTVKEYRLNGRLYMVEVTPQHGRPYYLIDNVGRGEFTRLDSYDTGTRPPMWVIHRW
jgi:Protein of unknown function (DUF2782)